MTARTGKHTPDRQPDAALDAWLHSQDFYELCQRYRHAGYRAGLEKALGISYFVRNAYLANSGKVMSEGERFQGADEVHRQIQMELRALKSTAPQVPLSTDPETEEQVKQARAALAKALGNE